LSLAKFAPYLEPLNEYLDNQELMTGPDGQKYSKDDMFEAAYKTVNMPDGKIYAIPKDMSEVVFYYRSDLINKPPDTWDEYIEMAKKYTKSIHADSPFTYGNIMQGKYEMWTFCAALDTIWPYGGNIFKPGTTDPDFDNEGTVKAMNVFAQLYKAGTYPPGVANAEYPEVFAALQNGEVPMGMQWNASYAPLNDPKQSPKVAGKMAIAAPPGVKGADGNVTRAMYVQTINLAINKNSVHKKEAFKFLSWVSFGEGAKMYAEKGGSSPVKSVWKAADAKPPFPQLADFVEKYGRSAPLHPDMPEIIMIGSSWVQKVEIGKATPEEAAKGLNKEIAEFLKGR
jgi:multiple sugar transport system substrate-binding protein